MTPSEELFALATRLKSAADTGDEEIRKPVEAVQAAARTVGKSFSGSWQGYHSRVYYQGFQPPPPGAHFSQEWGLKDMSYTSLGSYGDWVEWPAEQVQDHVLQLAGRPDLARARSAADAAEKVFEFAKSEMVSILQSELDHGADPFLETLRAQIERLDPLSAGGVAQRLAPPGSFMTRDSVVVGQGMQVPPHIGLLAEAKSISHAFAICSSACEIASKAASHLERKSRKSRAAARLGTNIFIGHGRSHVWRDLKDFVQDRLGLPWDEFNRVPVAGTTNIARLSEMLDAAAVAFVVMTAEDELVDGAMQARMNVIHEVGLFQGRLGFTKAIVLLEEGCEEFSNIQGLGQIRFPRGNVGAVFEDIRRVLEREGLIDD